MSFKGTFREEFLLRLHFASFMISSQATETQIREITSLSRSSVFQLKKEMAQENDYVFMTPLQKSEKSRKTKFENKALAEFGFNTTALFKESYQEFIEPKLGALKMMRKHGEKKEIIAEVVQIWLDNM